MKNARTVTRYKTHSLLLPSLPSPSSPLTEIPPVFSVRAYRRGEGSSIHDGGDFPSAQSLHEDGCPGDALSVAERPGGVQAPGTETNGMQGPLISFCALCGREFEPQNTRRGQPKRFCSDACRARAWRRRDDAQNSQNSGSPDPEGISVISVRHLEESDPNLQPPVDTARPSQEGDKE